MHVISISSTEKFENSKKSASKLCKPKLKSERIENLENY